MLLDVNYKTKNKFIEITKAMTFNSIKQRIILAFEQLTYREFDIQYEDQDYDLIHLSNQIDLEQLFLLEMEIAVVRIVQIGQELPRFEHKKIEEKYLFEGQNAIDNHQKVQQSIDKVDNKDLITNIELADKQHLSAQVNNHVEARKSKGQKIYEQGTKIKKFLKKMLIKSNSNQVELKQQNNHQVSEEKELKILEKNMNEGGAYLMKRLKISKKLAEFFCSKYPKLGSQALLGMFCKEVLNGK